MAHLGAHAQAVEQLFVVLRQLVSEGCSNLYMTTSCMKFVPCVPRARCCVAARFTGVCQPQNESNASLSRLMIGAEPAALEHRPAHAAISGLADA